jgi:hypothetical protein
LIWVIPTKQPVKTPAHLVIFGYLCTRIVTRKL